MKTTTTKKVYFLYSLILNIHTKARTVSIQFLLVGFHVARQYVSNELLRNLIIHF
jgi:hypothetical protein